MSKQKNSYGYRFTGDAGSMFPGMNPDLVYALTAVAADCTARAERGAATAGVARRLAECSALWESALGGIE